MLLSDLHSIDSRLSKMLHTKLGASSMEIDEEEDMKPLIIEAMERLSQKFNLTDISP